MTETDQIQFLNPRELRPHEEVITYRAFLVLLGMFLKRSIKHPVLVDADTGAILDGHHRVWASTRLGLGVIPCYCVDYLNDGEVICESWRPEIVVTKESVLAMAVSGEKYPPKTSKHIYSLPAHESYSLRELR